MRRGVVSFLFFGEEGVFSLADFRLDFLLIASRLEGLVSVEGTSAVETFKAALAEREEVALAVPVFWAGEDVPSPVLSKLFLSSHHTQKRLMLLHTAK